MNTAIVRLTILNRTSDEVLQRYLAMQMVKIINTFDIAGVESVDVKTVQTLGWWNVHHVTIEYADESRDPSIIRKVLVNQIGSDNVGDSVLDHVKFTDVKE